MKKNNFKVNDIVCISVAALYKKYGENLSYGGILYTPEGIDNDNCSYYDLYNGFGALDCMDGEECKIIYIDNEKYTLLNENGDVDRIFDLSLEEFKVATEEMIIINDLIYNLQFKEQVNISNGTDILVIIPKGITLEQAKEIDNKCQACTTEYGEINDDDYSEFDFYGMIEKILNDLCIEYHYPQIDHTIYL